MNQEKLREQLLHIIDSGLTARAIAKHTEKIFKTINYDEKSYEIFARYFIGHLCNGIHNHYRDVSTEKSLDF